MQFALPCCCFLTFPLNWIRVRKVEYVQIWNQSTQIFKNMSRFRFLMKTSPAAILLIVIFTVFSVAAQYFYKTGAAALELNVQAIITNYNIFLGLFFYALGAVLVLFALKKAELSVAYPFFALSYVWVALVALFVLNEVLLLINWLGIFFIAAGISLVGYG